MKKNITSLILMAVLVGPGMSCWADDVNVTGNNNSPLEHPINAYTNHEVNGDIKDSQLFSQKVADAKVAYTQAKADYNKSLADNGADSQVTKDAQSRMRDARKDMHTYNLKLAKANQATKDDETKAQH